jgi:hypothetical protein
MTLDGQVGRRHFGSGYGGPFFGAPRMLLDTAGHPMSEDLHLVERFKRLDAEHLQYDVTVSDPKYYSKP